MNTSFYYKRILAILSVLTLPILAIAQVYNFSEGLALIRQNKKWGYINEKGTIVIQPQFDRACDFSEGLAGIFQDNKWGYIDKNGKIVIRPQFDNICNFSDGLALIRLKGKWGYINKSGEIMIYSQFEHVFSFSDGMARIFQNQKWGYIGKNGKIAIPPQFDGAYDFCNGFAKIKRNGKTEYIDKSGRIIGKVSTASTLNQYIQANLTPLESISEYIKPRVEQEINVWQKKGEFENTIKWQERVNENARNAKINELTNKYKTEYSQLVEDYKAKYKSLCDIYYTSKENAKRLDLDANHLSLSVYDADNESFMVSSSGDFADILLPVPIEEAPSFKENWEKVRQTAELRYVPNGDDVALVSVTFTNNGKKYTYDGSTNVKYAITDVDYNFKPIEIALNDQTNIDYSFDPIEAAGGQNVVQTIGQKQAQIDRRKVSVGDQSDVDVDIPVSLKTNANTFAVIIGNENYHKVSRVQYAQNDAATFAAYCQKTLGMPEKNIRSYANATYATMLSAVKDIRDIAKAYKGDLNIIFYYAGHGIPNESTGDAFLLPVDADGRQTEVCYPLNRLYSELGGMEARSVTVFMDACFSGSERGNQMLAAARGVAIKAKASAPSGNMIVFSAASGDETAYPYREKGHGLFTYFLLKKLQETKGDVSLSELGSYIVDNVSKESIVSNGKSQTPTVTASPSVADTWQNMKLR